MRELFKYLEAVQIGVTVVQSNDRQRRSICHFLSSLYVGNAQLRLGLLAGILCRQATLDGWIFLPGLSERMHEPYVLA